MNDPIEAEVVQPNLALTKSNTDAQPIAPTPSKTDSPLSPQQYRAVEINAALLPAYEKASTLELSEAEIGALMEPFPDEMIEIRPNDGLIYIPHIHISDRLNKVLRPGKWSLPCRRHWLEGGTMYGEYILLIRGCYVGESTGGHSYQPNNAKVNYSDTLESTAGEALRRICGKRLSCGSQVWNPEYARQWQAKFAVQVNGKWQRRFAPSPHTTQPVRNAPEPTAGAKDDVSRAIVFGEKEQTKFRNEAESWLKKERDAWIKANNSIAAWVYAVANGLILQTEQLSAVTWSKLFPLSDAIEAAIKAIRTGQPEAGAKRKLSVQLIERKEALTKAIGEVGIGDVERAAFQSAYGPPGASTEDAGPPPTMPRGVDLNTEWFWDVFISIPRKGQKKADYEKNPDTIRSLYDAAHDGNDTSRKRLWGLAHNYKPEPRTVGGKTYQPSEADKKTREALDAFLEWEEAKGEQGAEAMRDGVDEEDSQVPF